MRICAFIIFFFTHQALMPFTIMIDPSGDAKHTGRVIQDTFERGITLQCAERLKKEINQCLPDLRVVLTRVPGETIQPLQHASFANRLQADLYLSICFYPEPELPSHVAMFHYLSSPTDLWHEFTPLSFYHITQAHLINIKKTIHIGNTLLKHLQTNSSFITQGLFAVPFKPLLGIKAPALAIEAGLCKKEDWKHLINPILTALQEAIHA